MGFRRLSQKGVSSADPKNISNTYNKSAVKSKHQLSGFLSEITEAEDHFGCISNAVIIIAIFFDLFSISYP